MNNKYLIFGIIPWSLIKCKKVNDIGHVNSFVQAVRISFPLLLSLKQNEKCSISYEIFHSNCSTDNIICALKNYMNTL